MASATGSSPRAEVTDIPGAAMAALALSSQILNVIVPATANARAGRTAHRGVAAESGSTPGMSQTTDTDTDVKTCQRGEGGQVHIHARNTDQSRCATSAHT